MAIRLVNNGYARGGIDDVVERQGHLPVGSDDAGRSGEVGAIGVTADRDQDGIAGDDRDGLTGRSIADNRSGVSSDREAAVGILEKVTHGVGNVARRLDTQRVGERLVQPRLGVARWSKGRIFAHELVAQIPADDSVSRGRIAGSARGNAADGTDGLGGDARPGGGAALDGVGDDDGRVLLEQRVVRHGLEATTRPTRRHEGCRARRGGAVGVDPAHKVIAVKCPSGDGIRAYGDDAARGVDNVAGNRAEELSNGGDTTVGEREAGIGVARVMDGRGGNRKPYALGLDGSVGRAAVLLDLEAQGDDVLLPMREQRCEDGRHRNGRARAVKHFSVSRKRPAVKQVASARDLGVVRQGDVGLGSCDDGRVDALGEGATVRVEGYGLATGNPKRDEVETAVGNDEGGKVLHGVGVAVGGAPAIEHPALVGCRLALEDGCKRSGDGLGVILRREGAMLAGLVGDPDQTLPDGGSLGVAKGDDVIEGVDGACGDGAVVGGHDDLPPLENPTGIGGDVQNRVTVRAVHDVGDEYLLRDGTGYPAVDGKACAGSEGSVRLGAGVDDQVVGLCRPDAEEPERLSVRESDLVHVRVDLGTVDAGRPSLELVAVRTEATLGKRRRNAGNDSLAGHGADGGGVGGNVGIVDYVGIRNDPVGDEADVVVDDEALHCGEVRLAIEGLSRIEGTVAVGVDEPSAEGVAGVIALGRHAIGTDERRYLGTGGDVREERVPLLRAKRPVVAGKIAEGVSVGPLREEDRGSDDRVVRDGVGRDCRVLLLALAVIGDGPAREEASFGRGDDHAVEGGLRSIPDCLTVLTRDGSLRDVGAGKGDAHALCRPLSEEVDGGTVAVREVADIAL